jgi:hypothetical protein
MKTHTQQQTKLKIETTVTESKLNRQKRSEYRPRKWRGNTLVPVIIALAISAIATIAFLNQGADLSTKNKIVVAQNEIASAISDWVVIRETSGVGTDKDDPKPADRGNIFNVSGTKFGRPAAAVNAIQDVMPAFSIGAPYMVYQTDSKASCNILRKRLSAKIDGVLTAKCISAAIPGSGLIDGKYLLIALN